MILMITIMMTMIMITMANKDDHDDYNSDDNDDDAKEQEAAPVSHHCVFTRAECPTTKRVTEHKNTNAASMPTIIIMILEK